MTNKIIMLFFVSLLLVSSVNVGSATSIPAIPNLAWMVQTSDIIVEVTVVDINIKQITVNDSKDVPYETQSVSYILKVNEILKPNKNLKKGEKLIFDSGRTQELNLGDHAILMKISDEPPGNYFPNQTLLIQEGEIYSNSYYQISLKDLKTFAQKSDDYYKKYSRAFSHYDIVVAKMLTDTDINKTRYNFYDASPHQIHEIEVINSASGKFTGNREFDYVISYFSEKLLQEMDEVPFYLLDLFRSYMGWVETSDGYYSPEKWDLESSPLKKDDYYVIYVGYYDMSSHYNKDIKPTSIEHIEKYDSKTQKELKKFIEEYQEAYEDVGKYEKRRGASQTNSSDQGGQESTIPGFSFVFATAAVISFAGLGLYQRRKKQ